MTEPTVFVVLDTKGAGRVVGVFERDAQAQEVQAVSPAYYRVFPLPMNSINPDSVRWVQDEHGRQTLSRLSTQTRAITEGVEPERKPRGALAVAIAGIAWQVLVIEFATRQATSLQGMLAGLGAAPPMITAAFLASYRWWPLVPVACAAQLIWAHRRARSSTAMVVAASIALGAGLVLQTWTNEAALAPLRDLISRL